MTTSAARVWAEPTPPSALAGASVLVLEDNEFQRVAMMQTLRSLGVSYAAEAADVAAALQCVAERPGGFDICLCDLNLGEEEGVTFLRHSGMSGVRSFVFVSALAMADLLGARRRALEYGSLVAGVLTKPVRRNDLQAMLEKAVRESDRLR